MGSSASQILQKLCSIVFKEQLLVYFILDKAGRVKEWDGSLAELDFQEPEADSKISDCVIFMEGIIPLQGQTMEFSCIKMSADICVDALLFRIETGYGLIVWDSSKKDAFLTQTQQKFNELSLLIEKQKNQIIQMPGSTSPKEDAFLEDLFLALNFAVLEMNEQGHFVLIGTPPQWIEHIPQSSEILEGMAYQEDVFSFLGNFIRETKKRWAKNRKDIYRSGLWIEKDHTDQELLFEATAMDIHRRKLLIISHDVWHPNNTQSIIQKGRDLALNYHDLKRSGKKLKNMHDELELRVQERTKDLEQANFKLANELKERKKLEKEQAEVSNQLRQSQKMEAIGTLAGGIAHDFNNILAAIIGFTELSLTEPNTDAKLKSRLEKVLQASDRAKDLVRQILTFSHQSDYEKQPLKLKLVVMETLQLLRASLPAIIDIKKDLKSSGYILADYTQLHQVIMNLCTNAWHAMKDKGGTLCVDLKDMKLSSDDPLRPVDLPPGQYLVLTINDTGCGIRPDLVEKIFDPYFTTKDKDKGTGLGLSVVHGIITKCDGAITIDTQLEKGSTFKVFLPEFFPHIKTEIPQEPLFLGNNEHILFVDDEVFQIELAQEFVKRLGYQITTCTDSLEAFDLFSTSIDKFDLVITDMIMPKMTGKDLAKKIRTKNSHIPIILSTGYSDDIEKEKLDEIGITKCLMKPFGITELAKAIHVVLKK